MPRAGPGARSAALRTALTDRPMAQAAARPEHLDLAPVARVAGTIALPGSKSISNRTLLLAALAEGATGIAGLLDSDTARVYRVDRSTGMCEPIFR